MFGASLFKHQMQANTNIRTNPAVKNEKNKIIRKKNFNLMHSKSHTVTNLNTQFLTLVINQLSAKILVL